MLTELLKAIDDKDAARFVSFLSPDCRFRFGNQPEILGTAAVEEFATAFFDSIAALSHVVIASWNIPDGLLCHGQVTYTHQDGSMLAVPFANVFKLRDSAICEYLIFADASQLQQ